MKSITVLFWIFVFAMNTSYAQEQSGSGVTGTYKVHKKVNPFIKRWYCRLNNESTTTYFEVLHLKENKQFYHFLSSTCLPEEATGTWKEDGGFLVLESDSTCGLYFSGQKKYKLKGKSLALQDPNPLLKKKHPVLKKL